MTLVYGTKSFLLKKVSPDALGITSLTPGSMIEVYQKCFTLFFIPVFPYKKEVSYSRDGQYYNIPRELVDVTDKYKATVGGKWYSFSMFFVLIGLVAAFFIIDFAIKKSAPNLGDQLHEKSIKAYKNRLQRLDNRYVIFIQNVDATSEGNVLYITAVNGDVATVTVDLDSIEKKVSIAALNEAFTEDYDDFSRFKYEGEDLFGDGVKYTVLEVRMEFGPKIKIEDTEILDEGRYIYHLCNEGWPVTIENIKMIEGEMAWEQKFPLRMDSCIDLGGIIKSSYIEMEMSVKDTLGRPYKYVFSNSSISSEHMDDVSK
ncbi:MAG: hypothetical protein ACRCYO_08865 [Bacteroidia bacterium]